MDILGLFVQVERVLVLYFTQIPLRKASGVIRDAQKASTQHAGSVCLGSYSALLSQPLAKKHDRDPGSFV